MKKLYSKLILGGFMLGGLAFGQVQLNELTDFGTAIYDITNDGKGVHGNGYYDFATNTSSFPETGVGQTVAINDADQVVGLFDDGAGNYLPAYRNAGVWSIFPDTAFDPAVSYTIYDISENGTYVVGQTGWTPENGAWGFIYNTQTEILTILSSDLYEFGAAYAVNDNGIAVGWVDDLPAGTVRMPAYFGADGTITLIQEEYGEANGINEQNEIVGVYGDVPFTYSIADNEFATYNFPDGYISASFTDISENQIVVGFAEIYIEGQGFARNPIIFHPDLGAQPLLLVDVLTDLGVDATGLDGQGYRISNDGNYIAGWTSGPAFMALGWAVFFDDLLLGGGGDNDECDGAIAVSCGETVTGTTADATDSGGNEAADRFFSYTGTGSTETVTASLCGSAYDTYIRVFSDCTLTNEIAFNDDECGLQSEVSFTSDGTSTYIIMVEGYGTNSGDFTLNVTCDVIDGYCEPVLDCTDGDLITNVTFQEINNDSECSENGYANYTDQIANVEAEGTYSMSVTVGAGWTYESVMVWIDFNNNFVFEPSEYYFIGSDPGTTNTADITIPAGTADGQYRMRVRVGAVNPDLNDLSVMACDEDTVYGETEDYTINVGELGVGDMDSSNFAYYPNPVKDVLYFTSNKNVENVAVYNLAGQKVLTNAKVNNGQINVSSLETGVYVFKATLQGGQVETFKIVKK